MSPIPLLVAGIVLFLAVIGTWAFVITSDVDARIGSGGFALVIAAVVAGLLMAGFLWLGRWGRGRDD